MNLRDIFRRSEEPAEKYRDDDLGEMTFSEDDEAWVGSYKDIRYLIAYDREHLPSSELLDYAKDVLGDLEWLNSSLEQAKEDEKTTRPFFADEIAGLTWNDICFFKHKTAKRIIASLAGGQDYRAWRIEYEEKQCDGIGFDS